MLSPQDRRLYLRVQRKAATLSPEAASELLRAYEAIRAELSPAELQRLIESGRFDQLIDDALLDKHLQPFRERLIESVRKGAQSVEIANFRGGFDMLNPRVIDGIRALDSRVMNTIKQDIRETVRAYVENGLRDGVAPRTIARDLRSTIGLAPNQAEAVANYRAELESGKRGLHRSLRDRRFDKADLTPERIDRMVAAYEKRMTAHHANTVSRTATVDSLKLGQRLSWEEAVDKGIVDRGELWRKWISVGDDRVRPEHQRMNGEEVPFDSHYSNGDMVPGESTWNCRCIERVIVKRAA